jgi:hypothetical protein
MWISETWLNFVGSITGFAAFYFVLYRVDASFSNFDIWDALALLVAFLGIIGRLPMFILQIVRWRPPGS